MFSSSPAAQIVYAGPSPRGWHRLQLAAECLQKYAWTYEGPPPPPAPEGEEILEKDGKKSPALSKGRLLHVALAQRYAEMGFPHREWVCPEEAIEVVALLHGEQRYTPLIQQVYEAYDREYAFEAEHWSVIAVERMYDVNIRGHRLTGRVDLVLQDRYGRIYGCDHKTSGHLGAGTKHTRFYSVSGQMLAYSYMLRKEYGDQFSGMMVNLVQVTEEPQFLRSVLDRSPFMEEKFEQSVVDLEERISRTQALGRAHSDWPKAMSELTCYTRYGECAFFDRCRCGPDVRIGGNWEWQDT